RCSYRGTTERAAAGARRGPRGRVAAPGQPPGRARRPRGVARGRPLVDGRAGRPALLRRRPRVRPAPRGLPRRRGLLLVLAKRVNGGRVGPVRALPKRLVPGTVT